MPNITKRCIRIGRDNNKLLYISLIFAKKLTLQAFQKLEGFLIRKFATIKTLASINSKKSSYKYGNKDSPLFCNNLSSINNLILRKPKVH